MNFAERIIDYRKSLNWTQEILAEQCSVTRQAVAKWEKGESMPDIYTIAKLANLFSISIEELIHTTDAVVESQNYYIRRLQDGDQDTLCQLIHELGVLGRVTTALNEYTENDGSPSGDHIIIETYYPQSEYIYLLIRRYDGLGLGLFDLQGLTTKGEMSAYIRNGFEIDVSIFKDFFAWIKKEYKVKAALISVWEGQEEAILSSLGYRPADGICSVAIPLI